MFATYNKKFNEIHDLTAMVGWQYDRTDYDYSATKAMNVESAITSLNGQGEVYIDKIDKWKEAVMSVFGRFEL